MLDSDYFKRGSSADDTLTEKDVQPSPFASDTTVEVSVVGDSQHLDVPQSGAASVEEASASSVPVPVPLAPPVDFGPPPDGGLDAWMVIASTTLVLFAIFGLMTSFGQLMLYYLDHQLSEYSKSTVS